MFSILHLESVEALLYRSHTKTLYVALGSEKLDLQSPLFLYHRYPIVACGMRTFISDHSGMTPFSANLMTRLVGQARQETAKFSVTLREAITVSELIWTFAHLRLLSIHTTIVAHCRH